jgi:hypothetical protein
VTIPLVTSALDSVSSTGGAVEDMDEILVANETKGLPIVENLSIKTVLIAAIRPTQIIIINLYIFKLRMYKSYILYGIVGITVDLSLVVQWHQSDQT